MQPLKVKIVLTMLLLLTYVSHANDQKMQQGLLSAIKVCQNGNAASCYLLGQIYKMGKGGFDVDYNKAQYYFKLACQMDDIESCHLLGEAYYLGKEFPKNTLQAARYLKKSCETQKLGCSLLGDLLYKNEGTMKDYKRALLYSFKGCLAYESLGCLNTGFIYSKGHGVEQNKKQAMEYYLQACNLGNHQVCKLLKLKTRFNLKVITNPPGADIKINGYKKYSKDISLDRNRYTIQTSKKGYASDTRTFILNEDTTLYIKLDKLEK